MTDHGPRRETDGLSFVDGLRRQAVVVTCPSVDGVLAMPASWAWAEATTIWTLMNARSFGQARTDPFAAALVDSWLPGYVEARREEGDEFSEGADDESFDVEQYFGDDNRLVWRPLGCVVTANFLVQDHPDLAARYLGVVRPHWFEENAPGIRTSDRAALEADLRARGHEVRPWPDLAQSLLWPLKEHLDALRALL